MRVCVILLLLVLVAMEAYGLFALRKLRLFCGTVQSARPRVQTRHLSVHRKAMDAYKARREDGI